MQTKQTVAFDYICFAILNPINPVSTDPADKNLFRGFPIGDQSGFFASLYSGTTENYNSLIAQIRFNTFHKLQ